MKLKVGWKVLAISFSGELMSPIEIVGIGKVYYSIGRGAKPNFGCGPLTVFTKLKNARKFRSLQEKEVIKKVLCRPSKFRKVWIPQYQMSLRQLIENNPNTGITEDGVDLASVVYVLDEV